MPSVVFSDNPPTEMLICPSSWVSERIGGVEKYVVFVEGYAPGPLASTNTLSGKNFYTFFSSLPASRKKKDTDAGKVSPLGEKMAIVRVGVVMERP